MRGAGSGQPPLDPDTDPQAPVYQEEDTDPGVVEHGQTGAAVIDRALSRVPALRMFVARTPKVRHFLSLFGPSGRALRQRIPIPWVLFVLVGIYVAGIGGWLAYRYYTSREYQAAVAYQEAWSILGVDGGKRVSDAELQRAFELLIHAAYRMPEVKTIHEDLERLRWRYEERKLPLPRALEFGAEEASRRWTEIQKANAPILVVGLREHGWDFETLSRTPAKILLWSAILGGLLLLVFTYLWWTGVVAEWERTEERVREREVEVEALGEFRRRGR